MTIAGIPIPEPQSAEEESPDDEGEGEEEEGGEDDGIVLDSALPPGPVSVGATEGDAGVSAATSEPGALVAPATPTRPGSSSMEALVAVEPPPKLRRMDTGKSNLSTATTMVLQGASPAGDGMIVLDTPPPKIPKPEPSQTLAESSAPAAPAKILKPVEVEKEGARATFMIPAFFLAVCRFMHWP